MAEDRPVQLSPTRARQGVTLHVMRYVLGISISLCIVALVLSYLWA